MKSRASDVARDEVPRGKRNRAIRDAMRDMNSQLALLSQRVSGHLDLRGIDLQCLDLIDSSGPLSPTALGRLVSLHPATVTGIIDRLERDGWIRRERDPHDRRSVVLRPVDARRSDVLRLTAGMSAQMAKICADYSDDELELIARFLRDAADAGRAAVAELDEG